MRASRQILTGERLHFQDGPIDVVLRAWGAKAAVAEAYEAAWQRFTAVLDELAGELSELRRPIIEAPRVEGPIARRMVAAVRPHRQQFITPMAAVAGAVADDLLETLIQSAPLDRAFVNDGGDIAIHLTEGETMTIAVAGDFSDGAIPLINGEVTIPFGADIGGIATSGARGRSFSLGIADAVTVLARDAASADAAATIIANAVDIDHPAVERTPARMLDPDSDLGDRLVTTKVGALDSETIRAALARGAERARGLSAQGLIRDCALSLQGEVVTIGGTMARIGRRA